MENILTIKSMFELGIYRVRNNILTLIFYRLIGGEFYIMRILIVDDSPLICRQINEDHKFNGDELGNLDG